jgi:hypothetical protein
VTTPPTDVTATRWTAETEELIAAALYGKAGNFAKAPTPTRDGFLAYAQRALAALADAGLLLSPGATVLDQHYVSPLHWDGWQYGISDGEGEPTVYGDQDWVKSGQAIADGSWPDGRIVRRRVTLYGSPWERVAS